MFLQFTCLRGSFLEWFNILVGFKDVLNLIFQELREIFIRMHCLLLSSTFTTLLECTAIFLAAFILLFLLG